MLVEMRPIHTIRPYPDNPRINAHVVEAVMASLREFKWRQPLVVDEDDLLIVGHVRLEAALRLGETEVPVHVARGLTPAQVRAYRIADNKCGELAEHDLSASPERVTSMAGNGRKNR